MKRIRNYAALSAGILLLMVLLLIGSALLPKKLIRDRMLESAEYLCEKIVFFDMRENVNASKVDRYADSILLSIAWHFSPEKPVESVMLASYYHNRSQNENTSFLQSVTEDLPANQQYLRYWHGSAGVIRFLHLFWNIRTIYLFHGILTAVLLLALSGFLIRKRFFTEAVGFLLSMTAVSVWYVPLSLEYTWVFLLMLIFSILAVRTASGERPERLGFLFLAAGMLTSYLDFLTAETLTLLVPLLLAFRILTRRKGMEKRTAVRRSAGFTLLWGAGYTLTWAMKWVLASLILHENAMPYVLGHMEERLGGDVGVSLSEMLPGTLLRNIGCLFPLEEGDTGLGAAAAVLLFAAAFCVAFRNRRPDRVSCVFWGTVLLVPYLRFLIAHNHSWIHYFFTYRAQAACVLAFWFLLAELTVVPQLRTGGKKKRKKRKGRK